MKRPKICAVIVNNDLEAVKRVEPLVDLFEVRIDLIGDAWQQMVTHLERPWVACNRSMEEGGSWQGSEAGRREELLSALELGAAIIDIELVTGNLKEIVQLIKKKAKCLLSYHDIKGTPSIELMRGIIQRQMDAGADICKLVTTACKFEDNIAVLELISGFPQARVVSFAMGPLGGISRIMCPLVGGDFIYASVAEGKESAAGQITVSDLTRIYGMVRD